MEGLDDMLWAMESNANLAAGFGCVLYGYVLCIFFDKFFKSINHLTFSSLRSIVLCEKNHVSS